MSCFGCKWWHKHAVVLLWNIHVRHVWHKKLVTWLWKLAYFWGVICRSRGVVKFLMKDYAGALGDLNKADALDPNNSFILQYVSPSSIEVPCFELDGSSSPRLRQKFYGFWHLVIMCVVCCFCRLRGDVKCWMNDYQGALEDLTRSDRIKPNDTFTLRYGVHQIWEPDISFFFGQFPYWHALDCCSLLDTGLMVV